jgi:phage shock protein B
MFDNPFSMVVAIVFIVMVAAVLKARYRSQQSSTFSGKDRALNHAETEKLKDDVRRLKERVQVLERVITDQRESNDLSLEIDRLRNE